MDNTFYFDSGLSSSLVKKGFAGQFGFKNGSQTMEGRVIDTLNDNEKEYIMLNLIDN